MQLEEFVYNGRDNTISLRLSVDGKSIKHELTSRCQILVGATLVDSNVTPALFDFTKTDRISVKLGLLGLPVGRHRSKIAIYDNDNPNGLFFGGLAISVENGLFV